MFLSEEVIEYKRKINATINATDSSIPNPIPVGIKTTEGLARLLLDEKISTVLEMDETMCDSMISYARDINVTREQAIEKWQETAWHKMLKAKIDKLRGLRKELE